MLVAVLGAPRSLASELEAAGSVVLERSGVILDARVAAGPARRRKGKGGFAGTEVVPG